MSSLHGFLGGQLTLSFIAEQLYCVVRPFPLAWYAALGTVALGGQGLLHLPCHHHLLQALEAKPRRAGVRP